MPRNYSNTAPPVALTALVSATSTTLAVASTAGYPAVPFLLGLERGTANEEVALCTATTATSFTVQRGFDGTTAKAHDIGTSVEHTVAAIDYREATGPRTLRIPHTIAVPGDVVVPSGDVGVLPGFFVPVPALQTVHLHSWRTRVLTGTSATFSIQRNGTNLTTGQAATTTPASNGPAAPGYAIADGDYIQVVVTAINGTPRNMTISLYFDYTSVI